MSRVTLLTALSSDAGLQADWDVICECGGRLQGSAGCERAFDIVSARLAELGPVETALTRYDGWMPEEARIVTREGAMLPCLPLVGAAETVGWWDLDVLDLGRGTPEDIARAGAAVQGKAVLLRHEFPFGADTVHRRVKLAAAAAAGAAVVVMVQPIPGVGPVTGGANACPAPGFGISAEGAAMLMRAGGGRFLLRASRGIATARNLILDLPGLGPERVMLSAHLDGHAPGESAMDNASGVAVLLALARAAAPLLTSLEVGLTVGVFGAEEWSLSGSRAWLGGLPSQWVAAMRANLNLDTVVGGVGLTALTSGFPGLSAAVQAADPTIAIHEPIMVNSDHANFAAVGVPALRLIAGFGEPASPVAMLLTPGDRRAAVPEGQLGRAAAAAGRILWHLLTLDDVAMLRVGAADARPAVAGLAALPPQV
jgi:hypothetical protein